jgi:hypothetical protein
MNLVGDDVIVDKLGMHSVKGWPDPIEVYGLISLRAALPLG